MNIQTIHTDLYRLLTENRQPTEQGYLYVYGGRICKGGLPIPNDPVDLILAHLPIGDAPLLEGVPLLPEKVEVGTRVKVHTWLGVETTVTKIDGDIAFVGGAENIHDEKERTGYFSISRIQDYTITGKVELPKQEEDVEQLLEANHSHRDDGGDRVYYDYQVREILKAASQGKYSEVFNFLEKNDYLSDERKILEKEFLQSLSPAQEWVFEPEWEEYTPAISHESFPNWTEEKKLKTITTPEGRTIVQGKWILKNK